MRLFQRLFVVAFSVCVAYLSAGCGDIHDATRVEVKAEAATTSTSTSTTPTTVDRIAVRRWHAQILWNATVKLNDVIRLNAVAKKNAEAVRRASMSSSTVTTTRPAPTAPPLTINAGNSCWDIVARYFGDDLDWARRVVNRESGCTNAVNQEGCDTSGGTNSHAYGVFQLCYPLHRPTFLAVGCDQPLDMECNIRAARRLYDGAGRSPWGG